MRVYCVYYRGFVEVYYCSVLSECILQCIIGVLMVYFRVEYYIVLWSGVIIL